MLRVNIPVERLDDVGMDLLCRMLTYDPDQRISARQALEHPWFRDLNLYTM